VGSTDSGLAAEELPSGGPAEAGGAAVDETGPSGASSRRGRLLHRLRRHGVILTILAGATLARVWDLAAHLPQLYHPDEPGNIGLIESMVATGDLDPHFFNYPSLYMYLQALVSPDGPILGWLIPGDVAEVPVPITMGVSHAPSLPTLLLHRGLTVAFGVGVVLAVWLIGRRAFGGAVGPAVAAALVALSPNLIEHSQFVTPDMLAVLMSSLAVLATLKVLQTGSTRAYLAAGLLVGLSASSKYNAALVALVVVVAFLVNLRRRPVGPAVGRLVLAGVAAGIGFLLTTPYAVLDRETFLTDLNFERQHYATGHLGMEGDTPRFYARLLVGEETVIALLAVLGGVAVLTALRRQWRVVAVLLAFPLVYAAFVASMVVRNDRTIIVVLPLMAVFAGHGVQWALEQSRARLRPPLARPLVAAAGAALAVVVAFGVPSAVDTGAVHDARAAASQWVADHVPAGSVIAVESYGPWIDPEVYEVTGMEELPGRQLPEGVEYVIASEAMYGRFFAQPDAYAGQVAEYERMFGSWELVREFRQQDNGVRIYRVPAPA
jgi:4-amino-4-deoxy-L-arabinose transferase-like glycosyltransferase